MSTEHTPVRDDLGITDTIAGDGHEDESAWYDRATQMLHLRPWLLMERMTEETRTQVRREAALSRMNAADYVAAAVRNKVEELAQEGESLTVTLTPRTGEKLRALAAVLDTGAPEVLALLAHSAPGPEELDADDLPVTPRRFPRFGLKSRQARRIVRLAEITGMTPRGMLALLLNDTLDNFEDPASGLLPALVYGGMAWETPESGERAKARTETFLDRRKARTVKTEGRAA